MLQDYYVIINRGVGGTGHRREVVDGFNGTENIFIFQFMENVQLPCSKGYDTQISMHSATSIADVSLSQQFQKY